MPTKTKTPRLRKPRRDAAPTVLKEPALEERGILPPPLKLVPPRRTAVRTRAKTRAAATPRGRRAR